MRAYSFLYFERRAADIRRTRATVRLARAIIGAVFLSLCFAFILN